MAKKQRAPRVGTRAGGRRKHRRRPMPKWLRSSQLDAIARSRCLMLLAVLSGETPVSDAIAQARISRATYYQLENRALKAMLTALNPLGSGSVARSASAARIEQLENRVRQLEQERRRSQRLLLLSRKALWRRLPPLPRGRPPKNAYLASIRSGRPRSRGSKAKVAASAASIPTRVGETVS